MLHRDNPVARATECKGAEPTGLRNGTDVDRIAAAGRGRSAARAPVVTPVHHLILPTPAHTHPRRDAMPEPTKLQRWIDLIAFLVGRRLPVTADELMRGVPAYAAGWTSESETDRQSARRKFERDKDELRTLGIPIRTTRYTINFGREEIEGYEIDRRDFYLPYMKLVQSADGAAGSHDPGGAGFTPRHRIAHVEISELDAPLALEGLRRVSDVPGFPLLREARSAFRKLAFDLDPRAFDVTSPVLFVDPPGAAELTERLRTLSDALLARKRVRFRYHGIYRGSETERAVDAYGLLLQQGHWYLIGYDETRDDVRVFRVGRMDEVVANRKGRNQPDYEIPADFRLDAWVGRQAWELGEADEQPLTARVLFHFPLSLWAERNRRGTVEEQHADGSAVRAFEVHQVDPFLRWLLSLEGEAELRGPPELVDDLRRLAREIAAAHGESNDAG